METNAHRLMNGQAKYGIFIQWNIIWQEKGVKYWHMLQPGWILRTLCQVKEANTETHTVPSAS